MISSSNFFDRTLTDGRARTLAFGVAVTVALLLGLLSAGPAHTVTFTMDSTNDPGDEALDHLFGTWSYAEQDTGIMPEFILLDVDLPEIHGLRVLECLQEDERT